jgi:hypothetical protein
MVTGWRLTRTVLAPNAAPTVYRAMSMDFHDYRTGAALNKPSIQVALHQRRLARVFLPQNDNLKIHLHPQRNAKEMNATLTWRDGICPVSSKFC